MKVKNCKLSQKNVGHLMKNVKHKGEIADRKSQKRHHQWNAFPKGIACLKGFSCHLAR